MTNSTKSATMGAATSNGASVGRAPWRTPPNRVALELTSVLSDCGGSLRSVPLWDDRSLISGVRRLSFQLLMAL